MNKRAIIIVVLLLAVLGYALYAFVFAGASSNAGLKVTATPTANVFLNDKLMGKTPFDTNYKSGDYVLKLIPQDSSSQVTSWQGKVTLNPSLLTYVDRTLGPSELTSAGEILTLEKNPAGDAQLSVIAQPDAAAVIVDGQEKGAAPLLLKDMVAGEHDVSISSPGFVNRTLRVELTKGFKLVANFQLALQNEGGSASESATATPGAGSGTTTSSTSNTAAGNGPYVVIKDTPTGFLRVRMAPSVSATEAAQVKPGDKYTYTDEQNGWYKITYDTGKEGWISGQYATKQ
ncbi:PEGA domain-containing protein [Patescibacteria group bacterium]|nr:PEGA domain-containing protein [Patescibacteria group bacterium]